MRSRSIHSRMSFLISGNSACAASNNFNMTIHLAAILPIEREQVIANLPTGNKERGVSGAISN